MILILNLVFKYLYVRICVMSKVDNKILAISDEIKNLDLSSDIVENLYFYKYHSRYLQKLQKTSIDHDDPHYISTYSSFIGEIYENIIYELLLRYALNNDYIEKFVLKGPHQNNYKNQKNGLMIDLNDQIVYKAGYKDVTEFDALFFTKDSVWFVESTIVKTTTNLRKRLKKKKALLEVIFPNLTIKALIILNIGALGTSVFPSYATVWTTKALQNEDLVNNLIADLNTKSKHFTNYKNKKLIQSSDIKIVNFKYFDTLSWILKTVRKNNKNILDFTFLNSKKILRYFEVFSKFYIGFIDTTTFIEILKYFNIVNISEDIALSKIEDNKIFVTIEKTKDSFLVVYYLKILGDKLKRLDLDGDSLNVSNKDPKGFTAAEIKYIKYHLKDKYKLNLSNIQTIENHIESLSNIVEI